MAITLYGTVKMNNRAEVRFRLHVVGDFEVALELGTGSKKQPPILPDFGGDRFDMSFSKLPEAGKIYTRELHLSKKAGEPIDEPPIFHMKEGAAFMEAPVGENMRRWLVIFLANAQLNCPLARYFSQ